MILLKRVISNDILYDLTPDDQLCIVSWESHNTLLWLGFTITHGKGEDLTNIEKEHMPNKEG